jgi:hypothetical protein
LEINPVLEPLVNDDVDDEDSVNTDREKSNQIATISTEQDEKLREEIQTYEKRIQGLIEGVGMLKERVNKNLIKKSYYLIEFFSSPFRHVVVLIHNKLINFVQILIQHYMTLNNPNKILEYLVH